MIFGRDREIEHLYFLLSAERIVLLHSPSGAGKSSLVQAGLIPRLTPLFDVWGPTRVNLQPPESDSASVNRYVRSANLGFEARIPKDRQRLPEVISPRTLSEYVAKRPRRRSAPKNIVLIFDQFEEILTVDPLALDAKREFFDQVGELLQDPHVWALFALREDYLAPLDPYAEQVPTHLKNRFRLDLLGRGAAREAISKSVEEGGRDIARDAVEKLVNDLATMQVQQPDGTFESKTGPYVEPLHLQVACRGLWERMPEAKRTIDQVDIESFGDVTKALAEYYEREVAGIAGGDTRVERALREWVGGKLITPDGIRGQVLRGVGESEGLENELIGRLVDTHLVRGEQRAGALWYELSHDRLIEPVRKSNAAWLESHLSMLQRDAAVWNNKGRPSALLTQGRPLRNAERWAADHASDLTQVERDFLAASQEIRSARNRRVALLAGMSLIALIAIWFAVSESYKAVRERRGAQAIIDKAQLDAANAQEQVANATINAAKIVDTARKDADTANAAAANAGIQAEQQSRKARLATANLLAAQANDSAEKYPQRALLLAVEALNVNTTSGAPRTAAEQALRDALANSGGRGFGGREGAVTDVAISPDDHWLVTMSSTTISEGNVSGGMTSEVHVGQLWDLTDKNFVAPVVLENARGPVVISSDSHWLVTDGCFVDLSQKAPVCKPIHLNQSPDRLSGLAISPGNHWLISADPRQSAVLWDLTEDISRGKPRDLKLGGQFVVSPDGHWLVTGLYKTCPLHETESGEVYLWDLRAKDPEAIFRPLTGHLLAVTSAVFSPDSHLLMTASGCVVRHTGQQDTTARVWNLKADDPTSNPLVLDGHDGAIESIAISDDNRYVATAGGTVRVWDLKKKDSRTEIHVLHGNERSVSGLVFSHDGHWLFTHQKQGGASIWNLYPTDPEAKPVVSSSKEAVPLKVSEIAVSPDKRWLAMLDGSTVGILDLALGDSAGARILRGHDAIVTAVTFSPDGKWMATGSADKTARLWDLSADPSLAGPVVLDKRVATWRENRLSPDGKLTVSAGDNGTPRVSDPSTGQTVSELRGANVQSVAFSGDDKFVATVGSDNDALLWDPNSGQRKRTLPANKYDPIRMVAINANGQFVLAAGGRSAEVWEATRGQPLAKLDPSQVRQQYSGVAISPDGLLVITTEPYRARLWDVRAAGAEDKIVHESFELYIDIQELPVHNALFSPDGKFIVVLGGNSARLWESGSKRNLGVMTGVGTSATFSADGKLLVTYSGDKTARVWKLPPTNGNFESVELGGHAASVLNAAFSPDGKLVATGSDDKTARIWDAGTGRQLRVLQGHTGSVNRVAFSGDGRFLFTVSGGIAEDNPFSNGPSTFDGTVRAWEVATWKQVAELHGDIAAFSHEGRFAIIANDHHAAWVWETKTGHIVAELRAGNSDTVTTAAFSPDATLVATANQDGSSRVWKAATGQLLHTLPGHDGAVNAVSFSPDGKLLVTASEDNAARVWQIDTGRSQLLNHTSPVISAAFSSDGRLVATGSVDNSIRIWNMSSEELRTTPIVLRGYSEPSEISFSPDAHWLLARSGNKTYGWNLQLSELSALACRTAGRNLTASEWGQYFPGQPYRRTCPELPPGDSLPLSHHTPTGLPVRVDE
jgi:WD40 repeat protein